MKDIVIISNYVHLANETGNSRFVFLARILLENGHKVEIITSDFAHKHKIHRDIQNNHLKENDLTITFFHEIGYKKNISLRRVLSINLLAGKIHNYLRSRKKPDLIYCAMPPLELCFRAGIYANNCAIPFVIDLQDLWPESFKLAFKVPIVNDIAFYPLTKIATSCYARADAIVAVSKTYLDLALSYNQKVTEGNCVFLGTEMNKFDTIASRCPPRAHDSKFTVVYIGMLGRCYDIETAIKAISLLKYNGVVDIEFKIIGDGPNRSYLESIGRELKCPTTFTGFLPYADMVHQLMHSDVAINAFVKGSQQSVVNKVGDYAMAGLPVINSQESPEYRRLVDQFNLGLNCECENPTSIAKAIETLYRDKSLLSQISKASRKFAENHFDRKRTYQRIVTTINSLLDKTHKTNA